MRVTVKREIATIEAANKQLQGSISEQEQVFLKQREQMEKAKVTLSKMQAEQQEKFNRLEMDVLQAKVKRSVDDIYSNDVSVQEKINTREKFELIKDEKHPRDQSGKSLPKPLPVKKEEDEPEFITINFDGTQKENPVPKAELKSEDASSLDQKQMMKQVKNYDMDDQTKAFLEHYLMDETKPKDSVLEKEEIRTGISEERNDSPPKDKAPENNIKKTESLAKLDKLPAKDGQQEKPKT